MKPYYDHAGIMIYHGDCREILPHLSKVDLVLTDPPYGIGYDPSKHKDHQPINMIGDDKPFDASFLLALGNCILWGANCYSMTLPNRSGWLVWVKTNSTGELGCTSDAELAWTNCVKRTRVFRHLWAGYYRASEMGLHIHPTQKPVALMRWCLSLVDSELIFDPFMGSGTTLVAAKQIQRKAIGIEIEERYCEIAVKRLAQEVFTYNE